MLVFLFTYHKFCRLSETVTVMKTQGRQDGTMTDCDLDERLQ